MKSLLLCLLAPSLALAQFVTPPVPASGPGAGLKTSDYRTAGTGAVTYYVDPTGSDSNACTATGASACATPQGAINKIPKLLRDQVTVSLAAGTYPGFIISGFSADNGIQQTTGGLLIDGALANSTLATGSATGTALGAGQSAGSGSTFGTLCDSGATWTVNDLTGRFISTASPTNTALVVSSNTATCITVVGTWSLPVSAQTTYTIQDPSVVIGTGVTRPATPLVASSANRAGIFVLDNSLAWLQAAISIRNIRVASSAAIGVVIDDNSDIDLRTLQIRNTSSTANGVSIGDQYGGKGWTQIFNCDISINTSSGSAVRLTSGKLSFAGNHVNNAQAQGVGLKLGSLNIVNGGLAFVAGLSTFDITGFLHGIQVDQAFFSDRSNGTQLSHITCGAAAGIGIIVGDQAISSFSVPGATSSLSSVRTTKFTTCATAIRVIGPSVVDVISADGSVATTGFDVQLGGLITYAKAGMTLTAGTNEINLDNGRATANFADLTAGNCLAVMDTGSRVCAR